MKAKSKLVFGVGVNDADYAVQPTINGKQVVCQIYNVWKAMLMRCYSDKFKKKQPTYGGVTVCAEWLSFMNFRKWWLDNIVTGYQLDKDLLSDSKVYSPETCLYVPQWLNAFANDHRAARGKCMIGVYLSSPKGRFRSLCSNPFTKKQDDLGRFDSQLDAYQAWKARKLEIAFELKAAMDEMDPRIYPRMVLKINSAV